MDIFSRTRQQFHLPEGIIYLDGNSLGPLPVKAAARAAETIEREWGDMLITAWNKAGWMGQPRRIGDRVGRLIGAPHGSVVMGDTLSIKVFQALSAALDLRPDRKIILSDSGNFPTDLYMADGLIRSLGHGHVLKIVDPENVAKAIGDDVAAVMLTHVDYRTGRMHDMAAITEKAHRAGAIMIWDLAHSAGAVPLDLSGSNADFATGCTYKYLNGGPGAPAFIYVRPDHAAHVQPILSGWLGHEVPFAFDMNYRPGAGIDRMRVGTPPVVQMSILEAALDIWDGIDMLDARTRSIELCELFIEKVEASCPGVTLASPRDSERRGSQVSFHHAEGYAIMQALIARGVIGDFRAPDIMRFGFAPLYVSPDDVIHAAEILSEILSSRAWDTPEYRVRAAVT
jgi:kynureninase